MTDPGKQWQIRQGDVREVLAGMDDQSVHCVVTSPPYWGLRDYGLPPLLWGGSDECEHEWIVKEHQAADDRRGAGKRWQHKDAHYTDEYQEAYDNRTACYSHKVQHGFCRLCGCWRGSLGLEPRVEMFVAHLVGIFRQVKRVLRDDGTVWLNLGSSYASANMRPSQFPGSWHVPAYDSDDRGQPDSSEIDRVCHDCDDECLGDSQIRHAHRVHNDQSPRASAEHPQPKTHDTLPVGSKQASSGVSPHDVQESTSVSCTQSVEGVCGPEAKVSACQSELQTCAGDASAFVCNSACTSDTAEPSPTLAGRKSDRESSDSACGDPSCQGDCGICWAYYTIPLLKFKTKDIVPLPWLVGLALQADGWWLRSPIIWAKGLSFCETYSGSVMPESVRDRPTTSYEYVLLLTKSKSYFYDADAVREPQTGRAHSKGTKLHPPIEDAGIGHKDWHRYTPNLIVPGGRNLRSVWAIGDGVDEFTQYCFSQGVDLGALAAGYLDGQLELKDTWTINPYPFPDAHFATFPPKLVEPCIKAGTSERGCCPECAKPWERMVETGYKQHRKPGEWSERGQLAEGMARSASMYQYGSATKTSHTIGWRPGCSHGHDPIPCIVLDPFVGSGTSVMVALRLGRRAIGIDLSEEYCRMARQRVIDDCPMLNIPGEALAR